MSSLSPLRRLLPFAGLAAIATLLAACVTPYPETGAPILRPARAVRLEPRPPVAPREPRVTEIHGVTLSDDYFWMRERESPRVLRHLAAENEYTRAMMRHTERLQERLYTEMLGRIKQTDLSVPARKGDWEYYTRTEEGKPYPIHCRRPAGASGGDAAEQVLLDVNELGEGQPYCAVTNVTPSPDHQWLAYAVDHAGNEQYTLRFRDLRSGLDLPEEVRGTYYGFAWGNDNTTVFYTTVNATQRPDKVWRHRVGTDPSTDEIAFEEKDEAFYLSLEKSRSDRFVVISLASMSSAEAWFIDAGDGSTPPGAPQLIAGRRPKVEYTAEHQGDWFYIVTNDGATNFKLVRVPVADPAAAPEEVIPHDPAVMITGVDGFRDYLVIRARVAGLPTLRIRHLDSGREHSVEFPETAYTVSPTGNDEYDTRTLRFRYHSFITPPSVFDYDMESRERVLRKETEVLGGYDRTQYVSGRIEARAPDGTRVPISLVYRTGLERDGTNPTLLRAYGSYGAPSDPGFSPHNLSLLDRGFVIAIAHVRGGGDLGRTWYDAGRLEHKMNTFTDFIACAERLIEAGYTSPGKLAIEGGSAGGLLIGAVVNLRPDLFNAAIAQVPFVDVVNTMLDPGLLFTVLEYDQWGDPRDPVAFTRILSYSPYENVKPQAYPNILATAGLSDPRVNYWEPAKWVARLRAVNSGNSWILLKTKMGAGHGGASDRYEAIRDDAFEFAFLLDRLGVTAEPPPAAAPSGAQ